MVRCICCCKGEKAKGSAVLGYGHRSDKERLGDKVAIITRALKRQKKTERLML